jgi:hypothetical protein
MFMRLSDDFLEAPTFAEWSLFGSGYAGLGFLAFNASEMRTLWRNLAVEGLCRGSRPTFEKSNILGVSLLHRE